MKKKIKFNPGDNNYQWNAVASSPFQRRSLAIFPLDSKIKAKLLVVKQKYYELFFKNEKESYLSRNQHFLPKEKAKNEAKYLEEHKMLGDSRQIEFYFEKLLERIIARFEQNPQNLFVEADRIRSICQEEDFLIPEVEAFRSIENWDSFMELLRSINSNESTFKFELLIAAITRYARLCST